MSWIQNFFQKLKRDDANAFDESLVHNLKTDVSFLVNQKDSVKDVETRISYQYPKNAVPVPKDKIKPSVEKLPQKRKERHVSKQAQALPLTQPVKKEAVISGKEKPARSRRPFQPTETPSPVFGFKRPVKHSAAVEHELSHFLEEDAVSQFEQTEGKPELLKDSVPPELVPAEVSTIIEEVIQEELIPEEPVGELAESSEELNLILEESVHNEVSAADQQDEPDTLLKPDRPKRSHLPFNVMMLKQDREKWEAQKKQRSHKAEPLLVQSEAEASESKQLRVEKTTNLSIHDQTGGYKFPELGLLDPPISEEKDMEWLNYQEDLLNQTLTNFNVGASVVNITQGPAVTRFEVQPEPGVKVNKITNLSDDIKLSLAARDIRIEAPIPGKHTIGIEVPNPKSRPVRISEIIRSDVFIQSSSTLTAVLGLDIAGTPIVTDLKKMPHGLIAGATGSGKSVCINSILVSLLYKASPDDLKLLLIDPKMVELAPYNSIPHLVSPVITDVKAATAALKWAVEEMERRYELFAHTGVRDINRFNELAMEHKRYSDKLPYIVIIIDELADLMMMSPADVEEAICRIAQKARACGIHLIVATQRPSVDVITGLIKANIPTRVAFSVSSQVDSRTIIDVSGAEKLLGRGDMLFLENGSSKPVRLQGTFVSDEEIDHVVNHVKAEREPDYLFVQEELLKKAQISEEEDELFYEACEFIIEQGGASTSSLQRRFKIGYNRAARLMDFLELNGYISGANGSKPREVLITEADLESIQDQV
ncbi:DNA translocase FtsK [Neobacillus niacini]|uniref:DNA translocase FtsK n=1 Tax=Neobacillus niacini TaxID=86668 RepID=UPI0021CB306E|nr:DNA translocase FtsK [Neobacillus niacini]MCM3767162.1 DNA translocase FtsK [Neobacillus niacini]